MLIPLSCWTRTIIGIQFLLSTLLAGIWGSSLPSQQVMPCQSAPFASLLIHNCWSLPLMMKTWRLTMCECYVKQGWQKHRGYRDCSPLMYSGRPPFSSSIACRSVICVVLTTQDSPIAAVCDVKYLPGLANVHIAACLCVEYLGAAWLQQSLECCAYWWYVDMFEFQWMPTWDTLAPTGHPSMSLFEYHSLCFLLRQHANLAGTLSGHSSWVLSVAFCPDNQHFVTGCVFPPDPSPTCIATIWHSLVHNTRPGPGH